MAGVLYPFSAFAVQINDPYPKVIHPATNEICPIENYSPTPAGIAANREKYGIIKRIVYCVQGVVIPAAYKIMYRMSVDYFYGPVAAACTLALVLWGFLMAVGKNSAPMKDMFIVAIKIGAVSMFTFVLGQSSFFPDGAFPLMIDITDWLASIVSNYIGHSTTMKCAATLPMSDVWGRVDCALNSIFGGIFNPNFLVFGLIGFFVSCLLSGVFGLFIAAFGAVMVALLVFSILRATYIAITAYIALAFMAIVSPIFITTLLFSTTQQYFEKWLKLTMGFMMQPMFLFAYLSMMLAAFDTVVYDGRFSLYRSVVGSEFIGNYPQRLQAYPANTSINPSRDFMIGQWLIDSGTYNMASGAAVGVGTNPRLDAWVSQQNVGILGSTGTREINLDNFRRRDSMGLAINVLDNFAPVNVYKVDLPLMKVSWDNLALLYFDQSYAKIYKKYCGTNPSCSSVKLDKVQAEIDQYRLDYLIQLFLSFLIAVLTMYVFYILLDILPFLGAGIVGEKHSMPVLGTKGLSMPGNKIIGKLKSSLGKAAGVGT